MENRPLQNQTGATSVPQAVGSVVKPVLKKFPGKKHEVRNTVVMSLVALVVVGAGLVTGWVLSGNTIGKIGTGAGEKAAPGAKQTQSEAGLEDESTFRDDAEGKLVAGGIDGEGTHHLEVGSDKSHWVYLTSTVIDLSSFEGKNVHVWGETISARSAGWLMDVGKVKVVE